jgi:ParE toxin of type II toxin-antitoxin system, parDE
VIRRHVRFEAAFRRDLRAQLDWLTENEDDSSSLIERLQTGLDEAVELVSRFPDVGSIVEQDGTMVLRKLILRRLPYVIWFARDVADLSADIWFLRFFHARQDRPPAVPALRARASRRKR